MTLSWEDALKRSPLKLNIGGKNDHGGSRRQHWPGYVAVDLKGNSDEWNIRHRMPDRFGFPDNSVDRALSEHFLEHLKSHDVVEVAREVYRVLRPGGLFRIAVPDIFHPRKRCCIAAGHDVDDRHHQSLWTYRNMTVALVAAGFNTICPVHYWDENAVFHQTDIDWGLGHVKRSPQHDRRNRQGKEYGKLWSTSLIVDAFKVGGVISTQVDPIGDDAQWYPKLETSA